MTATTTTAATDFDLIASAFVVEDELERDDSWRTLVESLADDSLGHDDPERLVAPPLAQLWVGAAPS